MLIGARSPVLNKFVENLIVQPLSLFEQQVRFKFLFSCDPVMSYSEFVKLCEKVECLSSRVTHQLVNTYPELHKFRRELNSFQDELVGIIRELPNEEEEEVSREQRRLLNFNTRCYDKMEREFTRVIRSAAQGARDGARRVP